MEYKKGDTYKEFRNDVCVFQATVTSVTKKEMRVVDDTGQEWVISSEPIGKTESPAKE